MTAIMIKVELPIVNTWGVSLDNESANDVRRVVSLSRSGVELGKEEKALIEGMGPDWVNYAEFLELLVGRPDSPGAGLAFQEMERMSALFKKIREAAGSGSVLLSEADFDFVCKKVRLPYLTAFKQNYFDCIESILHSNAVDVAEKQE